MSRERDAGEWVELPAAGRQGDPPSWPLADLSDREADLWADLWSRPQALMWERQRQFLEVALYVRRLAEAEHRDSAVNLSTLVRQMSDSLGLTTPGLRSNRWKIVRDSESEGEEPESGTVVDAREMFQVVTGDGAV